MAHVGNWDWDEEEQEHYKRKEREHEERQKERERTLKSLHKGQVLEHSGGWNVIRAGQTKSDTYTIFLIIRSLDGDNIYGAIVAKAEVAGSAGKKYLYPDIKVGREESIDMNFGQSVGGMFFSAKDMKDTKDFHKVVRTVFEQ